jgi:hypothetical protein
MRLRIPDYKSGDKLKAVSEDIRKARVEQRACEHTILKAYTFLERISCNLLQKTRLRSYPSLIFLINSARLFQEI